MKGWGEAPWCAEVVGNYPLYLLNPFPNKCMTRAPVVVNRAKTRKGCSPEPTDSVACDSRVTPILSRLLPGGLYEAYPDYTLVV
jgi:hypothetical protein